MKFHSLRTSLVGGAFAILASILLGSCGGGGATPSGQGGDLVLLPNSGTLYAGVEATFVITGGRKPYQLVSSEPGLLPVPSTLNGNSFTVVPSNPGVIDAGLPPGSLPVRSVNINVLDSLNLTTQVTIKVAQNFLTGYGVSLTSNCPAATGAAAGPAACAGGETAVRIEPTFNGNLFGNRTFRLEVVRGPFAWVFPDGTTGNSVTVTTDHEGKTFAIFRVNTNVPTQLALFRIIDVETGVSTEELFTISGTPLAPTLAVIPDKFTFTGPNTAACGTGTATFLVFDGLPPYTATSSFGQVTVTPTTTNAQPGVFTFSVNDPNTCLTDATIVITDARLARGTLTITTQPGTAAPPPPPLRAIPSSVTLACGQTATVLVTGGDPAGTITPVTNDPNLTLSPPGNPVSITRNGALPVLDPTVVIGTVTISDGTSITTVRVTHDKTCS